MRDEFSDRLWDFAVRIASGGFIAKHTCGTSSAPNYDEGCAAESREDFVHELGIATKEMRETRGCFGSLLKRNCNRIKVSSVIGMRTVAPHAL
jgi:hypothetical protein